MKNSDTRLDENPINLEIENLKALIYPLIQRVEQQEEEIKRLKRQIKQINDWRNTPSYHEPVVSDVMFSPKRYFNNSFFKEDNMPC